ncbi:MAG: DUF5667 domain-containing protein [Patescibacteria group bacterium]
MNELKSLFSVLVLLFAVPFLCLTFAFPVYSSDLLVPLAEEETLPESDEASDTSQATLSSSIDSSEPLLTPLSPFYFLRVVVENLSLLTKLSPGAKALYFLVRAERRLAEAQALGPDSDFSIVERLFAQREQYLQKALALSRQVAVSEEVREKIYTKTAQQLKLGTRFLEQNTREASGERKEQVKNLSYWRSSWLEELESGLGPRASFQQEDEYSSPEESQDRQEIEKEEETAQLESTSSVSVNQEEVLNLTGAAQEKKQDSQLGTFLSSIVDFFVGNRKPLLSPFAPVEKQ